MNITFLTKRKKPLCGLFISLLLFIEKHETRLHKRHIRVFFESMTLFGIEKAFSYRFFLPTLSLAQISHRVSHHGKVPAVRVMQIATLSSPRAYLRKLSISPENPGVYRS